jgi:hypothetical protein
MAKSVLRRGSQDLATWADDDTWDLGDDGTPFFQQGSGQTTQVVMSDFWETEAQGPGGLPIPVAMHHYKMQGMQ